MVPFPCWLAGVMHSELLTMLSMYYLFSQVSVQFFSVLVSVKFTHKMLVLSWGSVRSLNGNQMPLLFILEN